MRRLTWTLEVEDDQDVPEVGTLWDVQNDTVHFLDATLASVEDIPDEVSA